MEILLKDKIKEIAILDKRFWLKISNVCNNKCLFCLDSDFKFHKSFPSFDILKNRILTAYNSGYTRLILSGGEPTINPDYIEIIKYANKIGFKKIQTITNGRMFSYRSFADKALKAGLTEVTFSMHGHTKILHDKLTGIDGAFDQAIKGLINIVKSKKCIINIDIVINKLNLKYLTDIIDFFSKFKIYEYDLLYLIPFGRAYKNKEQLFINDNNFIKEIDNLITKYKNKNYYFWTNRVPPHLLENNEDLIQDPHKLYDEILGRKKMFNNYYKYGKVLCKIQGRCNACFVKGICDKFFYYNEYIEDPKKFDRVKFKKLDSNKVNLLNNMVKIERIETDYNNILKLDKVTSKIKKVIIQLDNIKIINNNVDILKNKGYIFHIKFITENFFKTIFNIKVNWIIDLNHNNNKIILDNYDFIFNNKEYITFNIPHYEILSEAKNEYNNILPVLSKFKIKIKNCTLCLNVNGFFEYEKNIDLDIIQNNRLNIKKLTNEFILNDYFVKSLRCKKCKYNDICKGMHINFIRVFNFKILKEVK